MKKFLHKVFFNISVGLTVIAVFIVILNVFARSIMNQVPTHSLDNTKLRTQAADAILNDPENTKSTPQKVLIGIYRTFSCSVIGQSCFTATKDDLNNSLLGKMANVSTYAIVNPPASGVQEVYNVVANAGLAPQIHAAQGIGFGSISGFRPIWKIFRDVSYGVLVLVMVVISFMIMFRMKLNAQTAISIESALPRIVLSLILITFSYALAGFFIDIMYVLLGISITLLCGNNQFCTASETINQYANAGMGDVWKGFFPYQGRGNFLTEIGMLIFNVTPEQRAIFSLSTSIMAILPGAIQGGIYVIGSIVNLALVNFIVALGTNSQFFELTKNFSAFTFSPGGLPASLIGGSIVALLLGLTFLTVPLLIAFIIYLTLIFLFFRIFFMLLSTYLNILFMILFAPIMMLFEALPGQNAFSYWIRNMIGELLTFPLLAIFLMVGSLIVNNFQFINPTEAQPIDWTSTNIWQPPFLSGWVGVEQESFLMVIGMGIIFITPDLIKMVKDMLGVKPPPVSINAGTFLAGGAMAWGGGMGLLGGAFKWSGLIYGHDKEGRDKGLPGKLGKMFGPAKEVFVKRAAPGNQSNVMSEDDRFAKHRKDLISSDWDTEFDTEYEMGTDAQGRATKSIKNVTPKLDQEKKPVKRKEPLWQFRPEGREQQDRIDWLARQKVEQENKVRAEQLAAFEAEKARQSSTAQNVQQSANQAAQNKAQDPNVIVRESGIVQPKPRIEKKDENTPTDTT